MNLYTNTIPFDICAVGKNSIIPVGSTFALVAVNSFGFLLKPPKNTECEIVHVVVDVFNIAFKEVELGE